MKEVCVVGLDLGGGQQSQKVAIGSGIFTDAELEG